MDLRADFEGLRWGFLKSRVFSTPPYPYFEKPCFYINHLLVNT
jgi:hypothetical protein